MLRDSEERFSPHMRGDIASDHLARYAFATMLIDADSEVLDIASGEGYGAAMLSGKASRVTGVDNSYDAVQHARAEYFSPNIRYIHGDATNLELDDAFFDYIVSFETIEHIKDPDKALSEMRRVLKPNGVLVISTPDRDVFNLGRAAPNPYHLHEFSAQEFESALSAQFRFVRMMGQNTARYSLIASMDGNPTSSFTIGSVDGQSIAMRPVIHKPMYMIAICSNGGLPAPPTIVFS